MAGLNCSMGTSGNIEYSEGIAIGAALALNAFSPAPSRVIVCSIGALAATVRLQCRQLRLHYCDRIGHAMAQYVLGTDRRWHRYRSRS